eukprot:6202871-Pleurochrysis_carterae.AAC.1
MKDAKDIRGFETFTAALDQSQGPEVHSTRQNPSLSTESIDDRNLFHIRQAPGGRKGSHSRPRTRAATLKARAKLCTITSTVTTSEKRKSTAVSPRAASQTFSFALMPPRRTCARRWEEKGASLESHGGGLSCVGSPVAPVKSAPSTNAKLSLA